MMEKEIDGRVDSEVTCPSLPRISLTLPSLSLRSFPLSILPAVKSLDYGRDAVR